VSVIRRRAVPQQSETQALRRLDRAVAMLEHYQRSGLTVVAIEDVLGLLGSDPASSAGTGRDRRTGVPRDPRADPHTGALWAGPPGSLPPGS
jgi:hypothetical protein